MVILENDQILVKTLPIGVYLYHFIEIDFNFIFVLSQKLSFNFGQHGSYNLNKNGIKLALNIYEIIVHVLYMNIHFHYLQTLHFIIGLIV